MSTELKPRTSEINARLWGRRAADWSDIQEVLMAPVYTAAFERAGVRAGSDVLDVGCGSGLAVQIASRLGARVSGLDAAPELLAVARSRVPAGEFHAGDLEQLPFADACFDLICGFNSFQYAGNPAVALREAARVARKGGVVLIMTWAPPEGMPAASLVAALKPLLPPPPPGAPGPFALSDEATLREFARSAGLDAGEVFDVDTPWRYATLDLALRGLGASGVAARAVDHSGEAAVDRAHREALEPFRQADGSYRVDATFRVLLARA
jgi:SAM-dependent methyltransferase